MDPLKMQKKKSYFQGLKGKKKSNWLFMCHDYSLPILQRKEKGKIKEIDSI